MSDQFDGMMLSASQSKLQHQQQKDPACFFSGNLANKMNEYLNIVIQRSDEEYNTKLRELKQRELMRQLESQRMRFSSHNHYYKVMKASVSKRKKNSKHPRIEQKISPANKIESVVKYESELIRKMQRTGSSLQMENRLSSYFAYQDVYNKQSHSSIHRHQNFERS